MLGAPIRSAGTWMMKKKNDGQRDAYWHSVQILFAAEKRAADLCLRMQLDVGQAQMNR